MAEDLINPVPGHVSFNDWKERLGDREAECPWPGPRPLRSGDDATLLVGREKDGRNFVRQVRDRRLVFLTGPTGVGKTSLLEVGLAGELRAAQFVVGICRNWTGSADADNPVDFLADKVFKEFEKHLPVDVTGADVFWTLDEKYPGRCVIVLDQFEELLRDSPLLRDAVFEIIAELNDSTELKIVVSFRSEYLQDLKQLERQIKPFTMSHVALDVVSDEYAIDLIKAPNRSETVPAIDAADDHPGPDGSCARVIAELWKSALNTDYGQVRVVRGERIGLLHLQALLYVLSYTAGKDTTVERTHLDALRAEGPRGESAYEFFARALQYAVRMKIEHCQEAAAGLDGWLIDGTLGTLAQVVRHLSSAGYKLIRGMGDLANSALESQIADLRTGMSGSKGATKRAGDGPCSQEEIDQLISTFIGLALTSDDEQSRVDLLRSSITEIAEKVDRSLAESGARPAVNWSDRLHRGAAPHAADPNGVTSGPMLGMAPANVLIEELRRFAFAVSWLNASDLARLSTPGAGSANLALIHDGFGAALERWSNPIRHSPGSMLASITAPRGAVWVGTPLEGRKSEPTIVLNQRWRSAFIGAQLKWVTFVGCDFRGAAFGGCTFEGVTFVNCLLDGVLITESSVLGVPPKGIRKDGDAAGKKDSDYFADQEPEFVIHGSAVIAAALGRYREVTVDSDELHIPLPGLPSELGTVEGSLLELPEPTGGLSIFGGRASALTMRTLDIGNKAGVLLANVAGSGIDIVEQNGGNFRIVNSAIRHLTVSPNLFEQSDDQRPLEMTIRNTAMVQTWISAGLSGKVKLRNCAAVQFWNDSQDVKVVAEEGTAYYDLVGATCDSTAKPMLADDAPVARKDTGVGLEDRFRWMTYRTDASRRDDEAS